MEGCVTDVLVGMEHPIARHSLHFGQQWLSAMVLSQATFVSILRQTALFTLHRGTSLSASQVRKRLVTMEGEQLSVFSLPRTGQRGTEYEGSEEDTG